ncbi:precorrin-3B synthase [Pseudanabaena sp. UWO310]|nr:precorrin-3B synthase [Pseudanabaena sp. UWO310]
MRLHHGIIFLEFSQLQSTTAICPSLFNATTAQDGILSRIRLPAGLITATQCEALLKVVNQFGNGEIQITNRANLQIRTHQALSEEVLLDLQDYGLASSNPSIDGLRNIMASPTAGIDMQAKINTIPLVKQWNLYLVNHPELAILSSKFSVCFDGGEMVNVSDRPNDIVFSALEFSGEIYFSLYLSFGDRGESPSPVGVLIAPHQVMEVLAAFADIYRDYTDLAEEKLNQNYSRLRPIRLREILKDWGMPRFLSTATERLGYSLQSIPPEILAREGDAQQCDRYRHLGINPQKQRGLAYIGVVVPLGRLTATQLQGLALLTTKYGGGALRLTPWQNILLTDIADGDIERVTQGLAHLGLSISVNHPYAAIAACSGYKGCKAAFTDTQADAKKVAAHLESCIKLDYPINIHFSGCDKSCAQHHSSDIALVGIPSENGETHPEMYRVYVGDDGNHFGKELYAEYAAKDLPILIEQLLRNYQSQRCSSTQTFKEFVK